MKVFFEIHTTSCKPVICAVDNQHTLNEAYETIVYSIENNTMLDREMIRDLFMQDNKNKDILSIVPDDILLEEYMNLNIEFFQAQSVGRMDKMYKLFVIDNIYLDRKSKNKPAPVYDDSLLYETPAISFSTIIKHTIGAFYVKL